MSRGAPALRLDLSSDASVAAAAAGEAGEAGHGEREGETDVRLHAGAEQQGRGRGGACAGEEHSCGGRDGDG